MVVVGVVVLVDGAVLGGSLERLVGAHGLVSDVLGGCCGCDAGEAAQEVGDKDDEPAAGFADEHLEGLDDGLFEGAVVAGVGRVAVGYALHVLLGISGGQFLERGRGG